VASGAEKIASFKTGAVNRLDASPHNRRTQVFGECGEQFFTPFGLNVRTDIVLLDPLVRSDPHSQAD
jgi:hypothetical protein